MSGFTSLLLPSLWKSNLKWVISYSVNTSGICPTTSESGLKVISRIDENGNGDNLNCEIIREKAYEDYKRFSGVSKITMQKFSKQLKGFCFTCDYIDCLNPEELHTSGGRILRRIEDPITHKKVQKEMIYLRTKQEADCLKNPHHPLRHNAPPAFLKK